MTASDLTLAPCPQAALDLASHGFEVFPLAFGPDGQKKSHAAAKHSGGRRWGASADRNELREMYRRWPNAGVGIATGPISGIFVLDVDTTEGHDVDGFASLAALEDEHGPLPDTVTAESPSGGRHLYFRWPAEGEPIITVAGKVAPGVDQRGAGGMVAAPPTLKPGKSTPYRWVVPPGRVPIADAPEWLLALCRKPKLSEQASASRPLPRGEASRQPAGLAEVAALLDFIDPDVGGYDAWRTVLMALHDHTGGSGAGLSLADAWSARGAKYSAGEVATKWKSFAAGSGVTMGTIAEMARQGGADLAKIARDHRTPQQPSRGSAPRPKEEARTRQAEPQTTQNQAGDSASGESVSGEAPEAGPEDPELTEDGVARAFTARFGERLRYDNEAGHWYVWTGDRWRADRTGVAFNWCREMARLLSTGAKPREMASVRRKAFASGVETFAQRDPAHRVTQDVWDRDLFLLGVPGGMVDLRTGRLVPPDPKKGITKLAAVAPADRDDCPLWKAFLLEAAGGDEETVAFLRRWFGYCLTGDTREHALIFFWGPGGNGKSVLLNTTSRIMGDYATTAAMDTFTASRNDKHPTDLALLRGARMVSASETEEGRTWAEARIKQMTGGDPISARFLHKNFFTFLPQFKLTIVGNHAPALVNVDDAARRRFNVVPFIHKPARPDRGLEDRLLAEWPAILRWMIDGAVEWLGSGLKQPEGVRAATADYFSEQDLTSLWLAEGCTLSPANPAHWETAADLFKSWSDFAKANGESPGTSKSMGPRLRRHGLKACSKWWNGRTVRAWEGVEIITPKEGSDG